MDTYDVTASKYLAKKQPNNQTKQQQNRERSK